jgi:lipoprotein-anchoring transpeptidase ErfK/SrfK
MRLLMTVIAAAFAVQLATPAAAEIVVTIDKSAQRMSVAVDGARQYAWPVSTGLAGGPPSGSYRPERLERKWYSRKFNWSPMPHAIFFHGGYAIHGTYYVSRLGRRASHGCVRLSPANAATLFSLVQKKGNGGTRIVVVR